MEMKAHAYSPSSCGKSDEKPSLIHTRPSRRDGWPGDGYRLFRLSAGKHPRQRGDYRGIGDELLKLRDGYVHVRSSREPKDKACTGGAAGTSYMNIILGYEITSKGSLRG